MHDNIKTWIQLVSENQLENQDESDQIARVSKDPRYIIGIENPSEAVQLAAMKKYWHTPASQRTLPSLIRFIKEPADSVQLMALTPSNESNFGGGNAFEIEDIKNPSWNNTQIKKTILKFMLDDITQYSAGASVILYRKLKQKQCPWPELDIIKNNDTFRRQYREQFSRNPEELKEQETFSAKTLPTTEEEQIAVVNKNPLYITKIANPSEAVQLAAMQKHWRTPIRDRMFSSLIQFIKEPAESVQLMALTHSDDRNFGGSVFEIENIKNPSWNNTQIKKTILKYMLGDLSNHSGLGAVHMYRKLRDKKCPWPELDVIKDNDKFRWEYRDQYDRDPD